MPSTGSKSTSASNPSLKKAVEPKFEPLGKMPETPEDLFRSLALDVSTSVSQPHPTDATEPAMKQDYVLPWLGFESWRDARKRLDHFERKFKGKIVWAPFNDSVSNDGPMSLNAYPGRAFIERVTNEGDANLEAKALTHQGPMPASPAEAVAKWFGLGPSALSTGLDDDRVREIAKSTVTVAAFVGDPKDHKDCILDARDRGIGLTGAEMPGTILSLNRGLKKSKAYLTGKHGQGASSTYQYSDLTLIASRKGSSKKVAFTLVEGDWDQENGVLAKTPTYKYLTVDGVVPEVEVPVADFPAGTLVRHIGYTAADLFSPFGENSLYGLLMRSLAEPLFPVWFEMYSLRADTKVQDYPAFPGFRRYGRLIRGTVNTLERAWADTLKASASEAGEIEGKILHRASEHFKLPKWNFGGRVGEVELGQVEITYWVADPNGRRSDDVLRNWVDPDKTIVMTLDGQTHAEESRAIVTGQHGAKLWAVGKYMVVQIDCNGLDPRAKYEMFTSTREHAKETPIKKMILEELLRRLSFDTRLAELNVQLAAADIQKPKDTGETISNLIKRYLKAAGISFEQLTRKIEKWIDVDVEQEVTVTKPELPPIEAVEPPTFVRWRFSGTLVKMHPGQRYSFVFETDAAPSYWKPGDQAASKIKVTAHVLRDTGAGEMKGGRVRCHFEAPDNAVVGTKGFIQVQLEFAMGAAKTHYLPVEIVEKPKPRPRYPKPDAPQVEDEDSKTKQVIKVKVRKKDFTEVDIPVVTPQPVKTSDQAWVTLGWPHDPSKVGFSIRELSGKVHLYYNVEFPPFLDMSRKMTKKSLEVEFVRRYEIKLVLHAIFTLNYDFVDEDDFTEDQRKRVRNLLCAMAESLALATKSEIEIEAKIKSEDGVPLETAVAANLQQSAAQAQEVTAGAVGQ